jgi:hypothetical protein
MHHNKQSVVFHFDHTGHSRTNAKLVRIQLTSEFTKVDFGYNARDLYIKGGWIRMAPDTFIEIVETGQRYTLQLAENIPIAPVHHYFESQKDWRYYSLFFPSIPQQDCSINIIEVENGLFRDFNYYDVKLRMEEGMEILE